MPPDAASPELTELIALENEVVEFKEGGLTAFDHDIGKYFSPCRTSEPAAGTRSRLADHLG